MSGYTSALSGPTEHLAEVLHCFFFERQFLKVLIKTSLVLSNMFTLSSAVVFVIVSHILS